MNFRSAGTSIFAPQALVISAWLLLRRSLKTLAMATSLIGPPLLPRASHTAPGAAVAAADQGQADGVVFGGVYVGDDCPGQHRGCRAQPLVFKNLRRASAVALTDKLLLLGKVFQLYWHHYRRIAGPLQAFLKISPPDSGEHRVAGFHEKNWMFLPPDFLSMQWGSVLPPFYAFTTAKNSPESLRSSPP